MIMLRNLLILFSLAASLEAKTVTVGPLPPLFLGLRGGPGCPLVQLSRLILPFVECLFQGIQHKIRFHRGLRPPAG